MDDGDRQILEFFATVRRTTCELLDRVPEGLLDRTAEGEDYPMRWLFVHVADGVNWWMHNVFADGKGVVRKPRPNKASIRRALEASADRLLTFFRAAGGQAMGRTFTFTDADGAETAWVGRDRVLYLAAHEVHHRGKIVLALRQWGFVKIPPLP